MIGGCQLLPTSLCVHSLAQPAFASPASNSGRTVLTFFAKPFVRSLKSCFDTHGSTSAFLLQAVSSCLSPDSYLHRLA